MSLEQQHAILDKTYKQLTDFCGKPPRGSVAPWWEASREGAELMLKYGVEYGNHCFLLSHSHSALSCFFTAKTLGVEELA